MGIVEEMQRAEWALAEARQMYDTNIEAAYRKVYEAEREYESRIRALEYKIKSLKKPLSTFKKVVLYGDRVTDPCTTIFLQPGVQALVEVGGNFGRGLFDSRNIVLIINAPDGRRIFSNGGPAMEQRAQEFASLVMNTCAQIADAPLTTEERFARLQNELFSAKADTSDIQAARNAYAQACSNTYAIQAAEGVFDRLRAANPTGVSDYEQAKRKQQHKHRAWAIAAIVIVLALAALVVPAILNALFSYL